MKNISFHKIVMEFIDQLKLSFKGDIDLSEAVKQVYSTDNSIYQLRPAVVIYPKDIKDLQSVAKLTQLKKFEEIVVTPRGGGTGTNGQALTNGIVVDLSRHMNQILYVDPVSQIAVVQAGVVKDQLNLELKKYGLFFAPELSTSNRATIGGMINTDASGQGSCRYGKTHHHVLELKTVLLNSEILESKAVQVEDLKDEIALKSNFQKNLYERLFELVDQHKLLIEKSFPKLNRSLTGYDLPSLYNKKIFNINNILCGSEGTLGFIVEAKLNLTPIPKFRVLINIGYDNFQNALKDVKALMVLDPLSIETIDSKILNLAKQDIVWQNVAQYFPDSIEANSIQGINLVEIDANTFDELEELKENFLLHLRNDKSINRISITFANGNNEINDIYKMRKRAVGLLGNVTGEKRPQPFVEDTAVPPEHLANYIAEFRALLDAKNLDYGMFGHGDAGVLHVRPLLDMKIEDSENLVQLISDQIVELTHKYGGVIWGEHGKGLRSEYAPIFFGESYPLIQKVKELFDPNNQLNPGKIATPINKPSAKLLKLLEVPLRGQNDKQVAVKDWKNFANTMHCNGNGACFNFDLNDPMCPSYKATRNRIHSPKGRATLIKEWLRRENIGAQNFQFDKEVYNAMHGCLSCKSCAGQCPIKVDIPDSKARFLQKYYQRHRRPLRDYIISYLECFIPNILKFSILFNAMQKLSFVKDFQKKILKVVDIPLFHSQAKVNLSDLGVTILEYDLNNLPENDTHGVILIQDAFTRYFDTPVFIETILFLKKLGIRPYIFPYLPNGKPLHVHGFIDQFENKRSENIRLLSKVAKTNMPLIGIDPAMTLVYRQEYKTFYDRPLPVLDFQVLMLQEWLDQWLKNNINNIPKLVTSNKFYLAGHCTERTQVPESAQQWQRVFKSFGLQLEPLALGCCGMSGTYGHETEHRTLSETIYSQSWKEKLHQLDDKVLVTGYSCRSQIKRLEQKEVSHPIQILNQLF